jgi:hypothetical protein
VSTKRGLCLCCRKFDDQPKTPKLRHEKAVAYRGVYVVGIQTRSKPMKQWPNHIKTFCLLQLSSPSSIIPQAGTPSPSGVRPCPRSLTLELWSPIRPYLPSCKITSSAWFPSGPQSSIPKALPPRQLCIADVVGFLLINHRLPVKINGEDELQVPQIAISP